MIFYFHKHDTFGKLLWYRDKHTYILLEIVTPLVLPRLVNMVCELWYSAAKRRLISLFRVYNRQNGPLYSMTQKLAH